MCLCIATSPVQNTLAIVLYEAALKADGWSSTCLLRPRLRLRSSRIHRSYIRVTLVVRPLSLANSAGASNYAELLLANSAGVSAATIHMTALDASVARPTTQW